jgi:hypothetical protein
MGTATTRRAGCFCRNAFSAARIVAPVAKPSSTLDGWHRQLIPQPAVDLLLFDLEIALLSASLSLLSSVLSVGSWLMDSLHSLERALFCLEK